MSIIGVDTLQAAVARGIATAFRRNGIGIEEEQNQAGRPSSNISIEDIELLRQFHFTWTEIANILSVSRSTIYRKVEEYGIRRELSYTVISDTAIDEQIRAIKLIHPNDGERMVIGHLRARGIFISRSRVRASIHRLDPLNTAIRRMVTIRRRVYYAEGPNSVWHIDGHHKLIRWRLVTHGGIDGFSRTVVYLKCSGNNKSGTVLQAFQSAIDIYGIPQKIRSDLGGENVEVWRLMVEHHSSESAVITGSSTHNERIERLWRDVFRCVSSIFYSMFRKMEAEGDLDPLNEVDIYCLHKVFLPRINYALQAFMNSWNNHSLSSERNQTPNQLFVQGALQQNQMIPFPPTGISLPHANAVVDVPNVKFTPCPALEHQLSLVDNLLPSVTSGRNIYTLIIEIVGQLTFIKQLF
jgi:hypothetical protein